MPTRPNTPCRHPGCEALIPYGKKYCDVHKPMHPEEVRSAASRGYGAAWQKASREFLRAYPLCEECMKQGKYYLSNAGVVTDANFSGALGSYLSEYGGEEIYNAISQYINPSEE